MIRFIVSATILILYSLGASLFTSFAFALVVAIGYFVAHFIIEVGEGASIDNLFGNGFKENPKSSKDDSCQVEDGPVKKMPWEGITISKTLNQAIEELIEQLIDTHVNTWYKTEISDDSAFVNEIRYQVRYAFSKIYQKLSHIDLSNLILFDLLPLAAIHVEKVAKISAQVDEKAYPQQLIEMKVVESLTDIHYALTSRQNEVNYLRQIADHLLNELLDESRIAGRSNDVDSPASIKFCSHTRSWPSHICRHFLRELFVFSFFIPVLDFIADPDSINQLLIILFDWKAHKFPCEEKDEENVEFLGGLTNFTANDAPDSLLQLKLSDILRDSRQLQMFTMFLKDVRGPVNELHFLSFAAEIHERMLNVQGNENLLNELYYDIWLLFSKFVHTGAAEQVSFPESFVAEFQKAVESHEYEKLDSSIEKAYQLIYKRLQYNYVIPFCQSDCYLGHLCGSPPVSIDELIVTEKKSNVGKKFTMPALESTFSVSQFRNRLWKFLMPTSTDSSMESFDRLSDIDYSVPLSSIDRMDLIDDLDSRDQTNIMDDTVTFDLKSVENAESMLNFEVSSVAYDGQSDDQQLESIPQEYSVFDNNRDINRWMVTIPFTQQWLDPISGRSVYVFVIHVERFDFGGLTANELDRGTNTGTLNKWSLIRRYNEFYVLESKLLEFHGDLIKCDPLPMRKSFGNKNLAFIEMQRPIFERFLQMLSRQSVLKRSDLLYMFLTSDEELKDSIQFSDLNPWNVVRKMPSKFARERGQNLKPFILSFLSTTLAPQAEIANEYNNDCCLPDNEQSETSSASSAAIESYCKAKKSLLSTVYGNNFPFLKVNSSDPFVESFVPLFNNLINVALFICNRFIFLPQWLFACLIAVRCFIGSIVNNVVASSLRQSLKEALSVSNRVRMVRFLHDSLFNYGAIPCTNQEKVLRAELAQRLTLEYLQDFLPSYLLNMLGRKQFRQGVVVLFYALQHPRLNKQLTYVFIDILFQKLFSVENSDYPLMKTD